VWLAGAEVVRVLELEVREDGQLVLQRLVGLEGPGELLQHLVARDTESEKHREQAHRRRSRGVLGARGARPHLFEKGQADQHAAGAMEEGTAREDFAHD
jgi:hypothetical protein